MLTPADQRQHQAEVRAVIAISCALAAGLMHAEGVAVNALKARLQAAKTIYYDAIDGRGGALQESRELFGKLRSEYPDNPIITAYAGSIQLLESARTLALWRKGKLAKDGLRLLDEAVSRAPDDLEVRFVRAASTFHLPGLFRRKEQSQADFAWLASRVPLAVASERLDRRLGAAALYHHGLLLERFGDQSAARAAWREAVRIGQGTGAGADAHKRLASSPD